MRSRAFLQGLQSSFTQCTYYVTHSMSQCKSSQPSLFQASHSIPASGSARAFKALCLGKRIPSKGLHLLIKTPSWHLASQSLQHCSRQPHSASSSSSWWPRSLSTLHSAQHLSVRMSALVTTMVTSQCPIGNWCLKNQGSLPCLSTHRHCSLPLRLSGPRAWDITMAALGKGACH